VNEHGAVIWNELHTREGARADEFYRAVFGYEPEQMGDGQTFDYSLYKVGGNMIGGRNQLGAEDSTPAGWLTYFAVDDPDVAVATATEGGASVLTPAHDSDYGRMAVLTDPWGAVFAVIQAPKDEGS
jgi:predicted enzyme related to lactoylglutathione lyase